MIPTFSPCFVAVANAGEKKKTDDNPPKIVDHLTSMFVKDGEAVLLSCRIIGAKKFDVVWLHNNKEIKPSKDFQYSNEANIYKLNIAEIDLPRRLWHLHLRGVQRRRGKLLVVHIKRTWYGVNSISHTLFVVTKVSVNHYRRI